MWLLQFIKNQQEPRASEEGEGAGRPDEKAKGDTSTDRVNDGDGDGDAHAANGDDAAVAGSAGANMQSTVATPMATAAAATAAAAAVAEVSGTTGAAESPAEVWRRPAREQPCLWLEAVAGCLKGQMWSVETSGATLGRASDNKLSLADKEMSRRHSKVYVVVIKK